MTILPLHVAGFDKGFTARFQLFRGFLSELAGHPMNISPSTVRSEVIIYSFNRCVSVSFLFQKAICRHLANVYTAHCSKHSIAAKLPLNEWAEGPNPRYEAPCQYELLWRLRIPGIAKLEIS